MKKLYIKTALDSVVVCGQFCDWNIDKAVRVDKKKGNKYISVENMPVGEYRVFSCKNFQSGEIFPSDGRQMGNRYFSDEVDETICCYF